MLDKSHRVAREIVSAYKQGRPLLWFIECDGVLITPDDEVRFQTLPPAILDPLRSLSDLPRVLVAVGGTRAASELRQFIPLHKLVFAGYSGADLVIGERHLGHSGVPLARRMIESIGKWIESDIGAIPNVHVTIRPLSVIIDLTSCAGEQANQARTLATRISDKFRATVKLNESDRTIEVTWVMASNSGEAMETLLKEYEEDSPLICCVGCHSWMNDAFMATQSRDGITIRIESTSAEIARHSLANSEEFVRFLTDVVEQLAESTKTAKITS